MINQIYIVEDSSFYLKIYSCLLESKSASIAISPSANQILWPVLLNSDLLILDLLMPGSDGFDILAKLDKLKYKGDVFIVSALSLNELPSMRNTLLSLDLNIRKILSKPFASAFFMAVLNSHPDYSRFIPYNIKSKNLFSRAINSGSLSVNYREHRNDSDPASTSLWARPELLFKTRILSEDNYIDMVKFSGLHTTYYKNVISRINQNYPNLAYSEHSHVTLAIPSLFLEYDEYFHFLKTTLCNQSITGLKIRIAIPDYDFFLKSANYMDKIMELKDAGLGLALDGANYSLRHLSTSHLEFFDEILLPETMSINSAIPSAHRKHFRSQLDNLRKNGVRFSLPYTTHSVEHSSATSPPV